MDFEIIWVQVIGLGCLLPSIGGFYDIKPNIMPVPSPMMFMVQGTQLKGSNITVVCGGIMFSNNKTITFSKYDMNLGMFNKINGSQLTGRYQIYRTRLKSPGGLVLGARLVIKDACYEDEGLYLCSVGDGKNTDTKRLTINIEGPPEFEEDEDEEDEEEEEESVVLGNSYTMECEARCFPPPMIKKWVDENGDDIENSDKYIRKGVGKRAIKSVNLKLTVVTVTEPFQEYTCIIGNQHGTVNKTFTVTAKPLIVMLIRKSNVTVDNQISLRCQVNDSLQGEQQLLWKFEYKDSPPLVLNNHPDRGQRFKIHTVAKSSILMYSELHIVKARFEDHGRYTCVHLNNGTVMTASNFITVQGAPNITSTTETVSTSIDESVQMVCNVTSRPVSQVVWYRHDQQIYNGKLRIESSVDDIYVTSVLYIDHVRQLGNTYSCRATNPYGTASFNISTVEKKTEGQSEGVDGTAIGVAVILIILVGAVFGVVVAMLWKRRRRTEVPKMNPALNLIERYNINSRNNSYSTGYENDGLEIDPDDFPRCRLKFKDRLGEGKFGKVLKAEALSICQSGTWETVAVKMWKDTATDGEKEDFYHELMIVKKITHHQNVVKFLGSSKAIGSDPVLMIMEFVSGGDLLRFLRTKRTYYNQLAGGTEQQESGATPGDTGSPEITIDSPKKPKGSELTLQPDLSPKDLLCFGHQIARGMAHIASLEIVHRDVAARNILISDSNVCKVSDFGLARDVEGADEYERTTKGPLPIRWMSPEALRDNVHSTKSDVWAYGVCLWEIATFGASPYPGKSVKMAMEAVLSGERLECPGHCNKEFFDVMESCWTRDPADRPCFTDLVQTLENLLETEGEYIMLDNFNKDIYCVLDTNPEEKL